MLFVFICFKILLFKKYKYSSFSSKFLDPFFQFFQHHSFRKMKHWIRRSRNLQTHFLTYLNWGKKLKYFFFCSLWTLLKHFHISSFVYSFVNVQVFHHFKIIKLLYNFVLNFHIIKNYIPKIGVGSFGILTTCLLSIS